MMFARRLSVMTLTAALAACSPADPPPDPGPAAPAASPATPAPDPSSPCAAAQLTLALESADAGAGNRGHTLAVTNVGPACTLEGWPEVRLLEEAGRTLEGVAVEQAPGGYFRAGQAPGPVQLATGARAYFDLLSSAVPHGDQTECPRVSAIRVSPPGDAAAMALDLELQPCGPRVRVTPVRPEAQP